MVLTIAIKGTRFSNDWDFWVYPPDIDFTPSKEIMITESMDGQALAILEAGGKVLFMPAAGSVKGDIPAGFTPIFWNTAWTQRQAPHTLGILCDPKNPAIAFFPTESHSNWQWWDLVTKSQIMILDDFPAGFRPIVGVIDDWFSNRRLGVLFEAMVKKGKLLVCSIDIHSDLDQRPVARQMRYSLLKYMESSEFKPKHNLDVQLIKNLLRKPPVLKSRDAKVITIDSEAIGNEGSKAIDGNPDTIWHTQWEPAAPNYPHEIVIDMGKVTEVKGFEYLPRQDMTNGWISKYEFYISSDRHNWEDAVVRGIFTRDRERKTIVFDKPRSGRFIKLVAVKGIDDQRFASIAEIDVIIDDQ
jgi:hypothetical protein